MNNDSQHYIFENINGLKIIKYFLVAVSVLLFAYGKLSLNFNMMLFGVAVIWLANLMHCFEKIKIRMLFLVFNIVIFVFLISRPMIDMLREPLWWQFTGRSNVFALNSLFITLVFLTLGHYAGEKVIEKKLLGKNQYGRVFKNKKSYLTDTEIYKTNLEFVSLVLFYISMFFVFMAETEKWMYMRGRDYAEIYVSFKSGLPFVFTLAANMNKYFLCVFLATFPKKLKAFFPLVLYVLSSVPYFLIGARSKLVINLIFVLVYYLIRDILCDKEKWMGKKEKVILIFGAPAGIAFLGAYNYIREGKKIVSGGVISLIVDFFYKQGVTFDILRVGYETIPKIKYTGFVNYTFGEIIDYVFHGNIAQFLWGARSLGTGQNEILGLYSNIFAHRLAYTAMKDNFLNGHGWGSSYLLDTYADWGYMGIVIFSFVLGAVFSSLVYLVKKNVFSSALALLILTWVYYCPRGSALLWLSFFVYAQCWVPLAICFLGAALLVKKYSFKNHILLTRDS